MFKIFYEIINFAIEKFCPLKKQAIQRGSKPGINWITEESLELRKNLNNLYWLKQNFIDEKLETDYKCLLKTYKYKLKLEKKLYYQKMIENKTNPADKQKYVWKLVKEKTGKTSNVQCMKLNINGTIVDRDSDVADSFANHFSTSVKLLNAHNFQHSVSAGTKCNLNNSNSFFFSPVTAQEIFEIIGNLKNTNSVGVDCISTKIIKYIAMYIALPLSDLINISIESGHFPEELKIGLVTPIYKKDDPLCIDNYRQITVSNVISKIVEKSMYSRMINYLDKHNIITECQNGFYPGRSTEAAVCEFVDFLYKHLDDKKTVGALFFDLTKAFDSLNLDFVKEKLFALGFRGNVWAWLMSYLSYRKIVVKINQAKSNEAIVNLGVPQGSVLGPLIFLMFINDLPEFMNAECNVIYADDVSFATIGNSPEELANKLTLIYNKFSKWCLNNHLILNHNKTVLMKFSLTNDSSKSFEIHAENLNMMSSESTKFLGTILDSSLSFRACTDNISKKVGSSYYAILQLKSTFSQQQLINIYYAMTYSHLSFNIVTWGNSRFSTKLFILQKKVIRLIFGINKRTSCRNYFQEYKILTVPCIYIYKNILFINRKLKSFLKSGDNHSYQTRHGNLLQIPPHRTTFFEKSPSYTGIQLYNKLPISIKENQNFNLFKKSLKDLLLQHSFYSIKEYMDCDFST